jgi:hypothetical protein
LQNPFESGFVVGDVVSFQIAFSRFNGIVDRLCHFLGGTADIAVVAIPRTPHFAGLTLFDMNRVPNSTPRVIMVMNLFYWHEDLLSVTENFAQQPDQGNRFTTQSGRWKLKHKIKQRRRCVPEALPDSSLARIARERERGAGSR